MPSTAEDRQVIPLTAKPAHARGKRAAVTCQLKCGDACARPAPNESGNSYFRDVANAALSRRALLGAGAAGALALSIPATAAAAPRSPGRPRPPAARGGLAFQAIAPVANTVDDLTVPAGYRWSPLIRWGDPITRRGVAFDPTAQSAKAQATQFGYNCDYLDIIEYDAGGRQAVLVANHEYTNENIMFPPTTDPEQQDRNKLTAIQAHGLSVVELERRRPGDPWRCREGAWLNRRITGSTVFSVDGPAAGHRLLKTKDDPTGRKVRGTLNNCSGGTTPWGTVLSGEENFNQYFVAEDTPENKRYGISSSEAGNRAWWSVDPRFDARNPDYANEVHRFGWVIELDPFDPKSTPVKHTALGRFKHEAANIRITADGRVAAYSGDDERFDYIYKFISRAKLAKGQGRKAKRHNMTLLSEGDLYVARFRGDSPAADIDGSGALPRDGQFDGRGEWLPLVKDNKSAVPGMSVAEVLIYTRLAADKVGATKMDRPEDIQCHPKTGAVYVALTNNTNRKEADEANPRTPNRDGHVLELREIGDDAGSTTFWWNILLLCGKPETAGTYFAGYTGAVSPIACPDNVAFDDAGNLWISTDGQPGSIGLNDALHKVTLEGPDRGKVEQFLAVPREAETCGPVIKDRDDLVFVCVQHPGEEGTWDNQHSFFPDYLPAGQHRGSKWGIPRPSVAQISRR